MDKRKELSFRYIRGEGVEIGALHQPLDIPANVSIKYIDRLCEDDILRHYPELKGMDIVSADIIDDAGHLKSLDDESYDFCISNHLLEHMRDPINAIKNWMRILKPGGILFLSVPDISNPLDNGRTLTSLDHLIKDSVEESGCEDYAHFLECARAWHNLSEEQEIEKLASFNYSRQYSIHYHTFSGTSFKDLLIYLKTSLNRFQMLEFVENEINGTKEYVAILEKANYEDVIHRELKSKINLDLNPLYYDVIIPVYNAYDDFVKCLYSALRHQCGYRIICIDDRSTDQRIDELFSNIELVGSERIVLLRNKTNLGFVKTANHGMKYSKKDVILLNSDTVVTKNWAEKIIRCAYSYNRIATVTPLSNNATICSVPNFYENNTIPSGFTVDNFADYIEDVSLRQYQEIPTAVGFCVFIRRSIIDEVGYFDEELFEDGYCEEVDFCLRASQRGYKNIVCDNTFIFHKGHASFLDKHERLSKRNFKNLLVRHPYYSQLVSSFCDKNVMKNILDNIRLRLKTYDMFGKKRRILYVLHGFGGGTEKHVFDLIESLKNGYVFYVLQRINFFLILSEYNNGNVLTYAFPLLDPPSAFQDHNEEYGAFVKKIVSTFRIDLIHVHHLLSHTFDIFDIAFTHNIPIFFTVHDYYALCPSIYLVDRDLHYCFNAENPEDCAGCARICYTEADSEFIIVWRQKFNKIFESVDLLIVPNQSVHNLLEKCLKLEKSKIELIEHGHGDELFDAGSYSKDTTKRFFCIAYVGVLDKSHKGMDLFYSLAQSPLLKKNIKWLIIGISDLHKNPGYYPDENIHVYGKYKDFRELKKILQEDVDLVINLSLCEVFSYTLSEAWASGVPVLVSNIGALKDRVERHGGGWVIDISDFKKIENKIIEIVHSTLDYQKKKNQISKIKLKNFKTMAKEYKGLYEEFLLDKTPLTSKGGFTNMEFFQSIICGAKNISSTIPDAQTSGSMNLFFHFAVNVVGNALKRTIKKLIGI